jgi:hypothetical protein
MTRLLSSLELHHSTTGATLEWAVDSFQSDLALLSEQPRPSQWSGSKVRMLFLLREIRFWVHSA